VLSNGPADPSKLAKQSKSELRFLEVSASESRALREEPMRRLQWRGSYH